MIHSAYGCILLSFHVCKIQREPNFFKEEKEKDLKSNPANRKFKHFTIDMENLKGMAQLRSLHYRHKFQINKYNLTNKCSSEDIHQVDWSRIFRNELINNVNQVLTQF